MKLLREYITGAKVYGDNEFGYSPKYVGFDDCENCKGVGYTSQKQHGWSYRQKLTQCQDCALRHGSIEFYDYQDVYKSLAKQVKQVIKCNARGKLSPEQRSQVENFNVNHPLAKQYRKLLYDVWAWQEPERIK